MQVQESFIYSLIFNPMPSLVKEDVELFEKFHRIGAIHPLKNFTDFISYFFQTFSLWIVSMTKIFGSIGYGINESFASQESKKVFIEWSKSVLYYSWISFCLPFIFLGGYASERCRKPFLEVEGPMTEDTALRKYFRLEEEMTQANLMIARLTKQKTDLDNEVAAHNMQFEQLTTFVQQSDMRGVVNALMQSRIEELNNEHARIVRSLRDDIETLGQLNRDLEETALRVEDIERQYNDVQLEIQAMKERERELGTEKLTCAQLQLWGRISRSARFGKMTLSAEELERAFPTSS